MDWVPVYDKRFLNRFNYTATRGIRQLYGAKSKAFFTSLLFLSFMFSKSIKKTLFLKS